MELLTLALRGPSIFKHNLHLKQLLLLPLDFLRQRLGVWQLQFVLRCKNFIAHSPKRILNQRVFFIRTQNQPNRIIFAGKFFPVFEIVEIHVHLAGISMGKFTELEIDRHQTFKYPMIEQQIEAKVPAVDRDSFLPGDKGKTEAELEQEFFKMFNQGLFELRSFSGLDWLDSV